MADVSSLYPQPPAQNQGLLSSSNPLALLDAASKVNALALFQKEFAAKQAQGRANLNAIGPGGYDPGLALQNLRNDPDASYGAGEAIGRVLANRGADIANTTALFNQQANQNQFLMTHIGALASKDKVTDEDLNNFVVTAARNTNIPSAMLTGWMRTLPRDPAQRKAAINAIAVGSLGTAASEPGAEIGFTPEGAPVAGTRGQAIYRSTGGGGPPAGPVAGPAAAPGIAAPPPGQVEAATAIGGASAKASIALREASDSSMVRKGMLGNLEEDLAHFTAGPGADWTKVGKAWVNRNVPLPKDWQFDPHSIASQEAFTKQATQLAQQQFAAIGGTGTDAKFSSAFETNPNETLSQLGNQTIIRLLKGNEDAIQAKQRAWLSWRKRFGPQTYDEFSQDFNARFDPRAFQFKYLSPQERQAYIDRMDPRDRGAFVRALTDAHKQGWISFGGQ